MKLQNKKGFTLIELLVVITIIGILATGATAVYTSQIQKARDTNRINDLKMLDSAVNQYYQDQSVYPDSTSATTFSGTLNPYVSRIPGDKKNGNLCYGPQGCGYLYKGGDLNGMTRAGYEISTAFESQAKASSEAANVNDKGVVATRFELGNAFSLGAMTTATALSGTGLYNSVTAGVQCIHIKGQ